MIALIFFFVTAVIFVFGGELNRAIIERAARGRSPAAPGTADVDDVDATDDAEK